MHDHARTLGEVPVIRWTPWVVLHPGQVSASVGLVVVDESSSVTGRPRQRGTALWADLVAVLGVTGQRQATG